MSEEKKETQVGLGNLYDFNKIAMEKLPYLTPIYLKIRQNIIEDFVEKMNNQYYMLLCNELKDYTLFNSNNNYDNIPTIASDVIECITNRGHIIEIEEDNNGAIALWMRSFQDNEIHCYYFFPYDLGVIDYEKEAANG